MGPKREGANLDPVQGDPIQKGFVDGRRDQIEGVNHQKLRGPRQNTKTKERFFPHEGKCKTHRGHGCQILTTWAVQN